MPKRGIGTTYPAPPLDFTDSGLIGPRPFMPVPCKREIFSSSVISFTTRAARSSGERAVFIHALAGLCPPACARTGDSATPKITMLSCRFVRNVRRGRVIILLWVFQFYSARSSQRGGLLVHPKKSNTKTLMYGLDSQSAGRGCSGQALYFRMPAWRAGSL